MDNIYNHKGFSNTSSFYILGLRIKDHAPKQEILNLLDRIIEKEDVSHRAILRAFRLKVVKLY
jgi:hypothetical protein